MKFSGSSAQPTFRKRNIARAQQFTKGCHSERGLRPGEELAGFAISDVGGTDTALSVAVDFALQRHASGVR